MPQHYLPELQDIQRHILQRGSFCPLQWLMDCGLLAYGDYERWRYGEIGTLENAVVCDRDMLSEVLHCARQHAQGLKLAGEPQHYQNWRPELTGQRLRFSRDAVLEQLLSQRWRRSEDIPQLDLFMDSGVATAENELTGCLADRRWNEAQIAYTQLCALAPNHIDLGRFETLVLYGKHMAAGGQVDASLLAEELAGLEEDIAPLALDLLGAKARDYLAPAWQRLAQSLTADATALDPSLPHASYAWAQIPDWLQVRDAIVATGGYERSAELLQRLSLALHASGEAEAALLVAARGIELAASQPENQIDPDAHTLVRQLWQDFDDSDELHPRGHFPAWLLLRQPGLVHHLDAAYPVPEGEAFRACAALLRCRAEGGDEIPARQALQRLSPSLLRVYHGG